MKKIPIIKAMALLFFGIAQAQTIPTESDTHVHDYSHESIISSGGMTSGSAGSISYSIGQLLHHSSEKSLHHGVQHIFQGCKDTLACNYDGNVTDDDGSCNYPGFGTDTQVHCDSYEWIDGEIYTESNTTATHTLQTVNGCDSVVTLNLTINNSHAESSLVVACDTYTWEWENTDTTITETGSYEHTFTNASGCDSVVTLNLIINESATGIDEQEHCDFYIWIDGKAYTESNTTATHTLQTVNGCDSVVTLNLTINESATGIDEQEHCDIYTWIDDKTYTESNTTATHTLQTVNGCDSVVTLNLTINHPLSNCDVCEYGIYLDNDADNDGVCNADEIEGCTDAIACNYDATPTTDTNPYLCVYKGLGACVECSGQQDGTGVIVDNDADNDGICDEFEVVGCTDALACNYHSLATDAGECIYSTDYECATCSGDQDGTGSIIHGICEGMPTINCGAPVYGDTRYSEHNIGNNISPENIYQFEVTAAGTYEFSTCGEPDFEFDTYLIIYDANMNVLVYNDDDCDRKSTIQETLDEGTYYVLVEGYLTSVGNYQLAMNCITTYPTINCGTTVYGNTSNSQHNIGNSSPENIYQFEVTAAGTYEFSTCGYANFDTYLRIYDANMHLLVYNDDACGLKSTVQETLDEGTYYVLVEGYSPADEGNFQLAMNCIDTGYSSDDEATTYPTINCGTTVYGNTSNSQNNYGGVSNEDIYQFEVTIPGNYKFSTCGSSYDTYLRIYQGNMFNEIESCDDCGPCSTRSIIEKTLHAGTYYVLVEGYSTNNGSYELEMTCPTVDAECTEVTVGGGSWQGEVSWHIISNGVQIASGGAPYDECLELDPEEQFTVVMSDSYGDGWNGNVLTIDGASFTLETGYEDEINDLFGEITNLLCPWCRVDASINENEEEIELTELSNELSVIYQPTTEHLTLKIKGYADDKLNYALYDIRGELLDHNKVTGKLTNINMQSLPSTIYLLKVSSEEKFIETFKIIKN